MEAHCAWGDAQPNAVSIVPYIQTGSKAGDVDCNQRCRSCGRAKQQKWIKKIDQIIIERFLRSSMGEPRVIVRPPSMGGDVLWVILDGLADRI